MTEERSGTPVGWKNRRLVFALATLALAIGLTLGALLMILLGVSNETAKDWIIALLAGPPEVLCLLAVAILGKKTHDLGTSSSLRHYCGVAGFLFNAVPLYLYAYLPDEMPGGATKYSILVVADIVLIGSLIFAGGEFWEKLRRVFIWNSPRTMQSAGTMPAAALR